VIKVKCYIYKIINNVTGQKYVGQTTNFSRRIGDHLTKLRANKHPNPKLQSSWNKYREENFSISKEKFDLTKEELDNKEQEEIQKENSFIDGFNLTVGGTGGNTRIRKLNFEQFCIAYLGNKKYEGMMNRTAEIFNCDSSTISAITRDIAYDDFREALSQLPQKEKDQYIIQFEDLLQIEANPPWVKSKKLDDETVVKFLCFISMYGRGAEALFLRHHQLSKGLGHHIKKGQYQEAQKKFLTLPETEVQRIADEYYNGEEVKPYKKTELKRTLQLNKTVVNCAL
jgi:group I intron endonuclease